MELASGKPRLRGVSHRAAFLVAPLAAVALVITALPYGARVIVAVLVYSVTLIGLYGVSSSYHLSTGSPRVQMWWKRADHATIFLTIAGTYTPLCVLGLDDDAGALMLVLVWAGALLGVLRATLWPRAPRLVNSTLYLALGWLMIAFMPEVRLAIGDGLLTIVLVGGAFYSVGAVIYALRWPDPRPAVFGYHEIFHLLVIAASICHFVVVLLLVRRS